MAVAAHPSPETLAAFARGDLPPSELATVAEHIGACAACCAALSRVPDDTLAGLARAAGGLTAGATATLAHAPPPAVTPDPVPAPLVDHPRYKILRELGAGGMGVVYKAEHRIMGRLVALKVMAPHLTAKAGAVDRFRKEVRAAAQLSHDNIVTAHDADEAGGLHFLVMEYVEGVSLDRLVAKKGPLAVPMACSFARQAALGLQHAHDKGMVHRDIKPQNIMVTRKARVKVMDFGLARFVNSDAEAPAGRLPFGAGKAVVDAVTNPNLLMGTPDYLSPEQAKNSHDVDSRSDVYSLGCTLFFLLTGKPPFAHAPSLIDKLLAHTEEAPPAIRELRPDVPEGVAAVLDRMLAKKPTDRFAEASEVAAALAPFVRSGGDKEVAGFEVIDAVVIAPPAVTEVTPIGTATPAPPAAAAAFAFDTAAVPESPTLTEAAKPRKAKKAKKSAARPWWKTTAAKVGAAVALVAVVAVAIAASGKKKPADPTPPGDGPQTVVAPPKPKASGTGSTTPKDDRNPFRNGGTVAAGQLPLLYVLPSYGLHWPDYEGVRRVLDAKGVKVVTASGDGEVKSPKRMPTDLRLAEVDASKYSGVIFCGVNTDEYVPTGRSGDTVARLIADMQQQGKPVTAICVGVRVLATHGVLKGKLAARSNIALKNHPDLEGAAGKWSDDGVVIAAGKVVTAGADSNATEFAETLAKAVLRE